MLSGLTTTPGGRDAGGSASYSACGMIFRPRKAPSIACTLISLGSAKWIVPRPRRPNSKRSRPHGRSASGTP